MNIFEDDAFSMQSLTADVNDMPFVPGQIGRLGIFQARGVPTTTISIERRDRTLRLINPTPRGGPGETRDRDTRNLRAFVIPHFQRDDSVNADEVQNVRAFGSESSVETVRGLVRDRMRQHTEDLDATIEHQRLGCLKGKVLDRDGNVMEDLFTSFGFAQPAAYNFGLGTATTKIRTKCANLKRQVQNNLRGQSFSSIHVMVGDDFWDALIDHDNVRESYLNWQSAAELRGDMEDDIFTYAGITFERHQVSAAHDAAKGSVSSDGGAKGDPWIPKAGGQVIVKGVRNMWLTRFAPADYEETVNTVGRPRYAKQWPKPNGKGRDMEVQTNVINLCTRPDLLIPVTA